MVSVVALWLPILVAAVIVFVASSIIHMLLQYHQSDFSQVPSEDEVMDALRKFDIPPGDYVVPRAASMKEMATPEFVAKYTKGPVAFMTVMPSGPPTMGASLVMWFVYSLLVGVFCALVAGSALPPGADYHIVFHLVALTGFCGYALALLQNTIWYKRHWVATLKSVFDGLVYALLTAGTFGWLWP